MIMLIQDPPPSPSWQCGAFCFHRRYKYEHSWSGISIGGPCSSSTSQDIEEWFKSSLMFLAGSSGLNVDRIKYSPPERRQRSTSDKICFAASVRVLVAEVMLSNVPLHTITSRDEFRKGKCRESATTNWCAGKRCLICCTTFAAKSPQITYQG